MNIKATVSRKKRLHGSISMWIVIALCIIALLLMIYNIIMANYWYVASYFIGVILGASYILVSLNELYSTWVAIDGNSILMRCWDNCFFPYQTLYSIKFFGELIPAKNIRLRIPISDITQIIIGTKTFIKRNTTDESFLEAVALYEKTRFNSNQRILEKTDILYINTNTDDSAFMSVTDFDAKQLIRILKAVSSRNPAIDIRTNGRAYRHFNINESNE